MKLEKLKPLYDFEYTWQRLPLEEKWNAMAEKIDDLVKLTNEIIDELNGREEK